MRDDTKKHERCLAKIAGKPHETPTPNRELFNESSIPRIRLASALRRLEATKRDERTV